MVVNTGKMNTEQIKMFNNQLCSIQLPGSSAIKTIMSVRHKDGITRPTGDYPEHWTDEWHGEDGGDAYGRSTSDGSNIADGRDGRIVV